ncbi:MAG: molybdopterin molybdotransferase MoeA [Elioraea sp.]|nr:molybdopterin molybdotransferase MoeA [Elioraea sp.]
MLSVEEARARILAALSPVGTEWVSLAEAWGRVLAEDVTARHDKPPADVSSMDGYAVRAADCARPPCRLRVVGSAPAGHPFAARIGPGEAVRVFTGSVIPDGADSVVVQEDTDLGETEVEVRAAADPGRHIRRRGGDFVAGTVLLRAPRRLTVRDVGLAAAADRPWLRVHRRPRVAILSTGDEVARPGDPIPDGGIVSSNALALAALVRGCGAEPIDLGIAPDNMDAIASLVRAPHGADLIVTSGGASVGAHDLIQASLVPEGLELGFWKIAMRPGKPFLFGHVRGTPLLGLPGNPVSALVCGLLFLAPALDRLSGLSGDPPAPEFARAGADLPANDMRADHLRARLERDGDGAWIATPFPAQDSAQMRIFAEAEALILRPPHAPAVRAGEPVPILRLGLRGY